MEGTLPRKNLSSFSLAGLLLGCFRQAIKPVNCGGNWVCFTGITMSANLRGQKRAIFVLQTGSKPNLIHLLSG